MSGIPPRLKERSPEARVAYLQGYQAGVRHAAEIVERDRRTELAVKYGYEPKFHKMQKLIAADVWKLAGLAQLVGADGEQMPVTDDKS